MKPIATLALLLMLAGCTVQHGSPAASATPVSSAPHIFSAVGSSDKTIAVPPGAQSAEIMVTCGSTDNGYLSVGVDNGDQTRDGKCPMTVRFRIPVAHTLHLSIDFGRGTGRSVTEVRFSASAFVPDSKVAAQCSDVSKVLSDIASAVNGYQSGDLDLAGWQKLMASAGDELKAVKGSGAIGTQLAALSDGYGSGELTPAHPTTDAATEAAEIANTLCLDNGSPLVIQSQYGG